MTRWRISVLVLLTGLLLSVSGVQAQSTIIRGHRVIEGSWNYCTPATASGTTYACDLLYAPGGYSIGTRYSFKADVDNSTGTVTINFNSLGAKTIKKVQSSVTTNLIAGDIRAGQMVDLMYDANGNMQMLSPSGNGTTIVASGTKTLNTTAVTSGTCGSAQTATATGAASTDVVVATFNADITGVTGYTADTTGTLRVDIYPTTDTVNFKVCNATASDITPGTVTLNWKVLR